VVDFTQQKSSDVSISYCCSFLRTKEMYHILKPIKKKKQISNWVVKRTILKKVKRGSALSKSKERLMGIPQMQDVFTWMKDFVSI
jgi:hypothetical protein